MNTKEMLKQVSALMGIMNPAEMSMSDTMAYISALAAIAQAESLSKIAEQLTKIENNVDTLAQMQVFTLK